LVVRRLRKTCDVCGHVHEQPLPDTVARVAIEHILPSGRVVDVALVGHSEAVLARAEIHHGHAVDKVKERHIGDLPWF